MSRLLIVHGTGGPRRSDDSVRREWISSVEDGLALAGYPAVAPDATLVNLDAPDRVPALGDSDPAAEAALLRRCWRAATFDTEAGAEPIGEDALAARLAWSRYFCGLTAEELTGTLRQVRAFATGPAAGHPAIDDVRAALAPDTEIVIGHSPGRGGGRAGPGRCRCRRSGVDHPGRTASPGRGTARVRTGHLGGSHRRAGHTAPGGRDRSGRRHREGVTRLRPSAARRSQLSGLAGVRQGARQPAGDLSRRLTSGACPERDMVLDGACRRPFR